MYVGVVWPLQTTRSRLSQDTRIYRTWYDGLMENIHYTVQIHPAAEGGYWAEVPALPGCFTQGDSLEEVTAKVREAMECHLSSLLRDGVPFPIEKRARKGFIFPVLVRAPKMA